MTEKENGKQPEPKEGKAGKATKKLAAPDAQTKKSGKSAAQGASAEKKTSSKLIPSELCRDYQTLALVLQGGGALGSYQCGVYEALHAADLRPDWFIGTSIGAINAALLAGNAPEDRVDRLHEFWDTICHPVGGAGLIADNIRHLLSWLPHSDWLSAWANSMGALGALSVGQRGFFSLRPMSPFLRHNGGPAATSFYDTSALKTTLERLVDFDRINDARQDVRLTVCAAEVTTGNSRYFDSRHQTIRAEHIMASGALPPAFPAVEIDGKLYWDGGVLSNTPLECVWQDEPPRDTLVLQVDLWSAHGRAPQKMADVFERQKDIQYSSRTRQGTDSGAEIRRLRHAIQAVLNNVPEQYLDDALRRELEHWAGSHVFNIVQLIYQAKPHEAQHKDYAFGLLAQREHWASGVADMQQTLAHPQIFVKPSRKKGVVTHDVHRLVAPKRRHKHHGYP